MSTLRAANVEFDSTSTVKIGYNQDGVVRITSTGALRLPVGGVANRPSIADSGLFRYNSDTTSLEYRTSDWIRIPKFTVQPSAVTPSGGIDGDIWFKV
jgi:hypothetical protein